MIMISSGILFSLAIVPDFNTFYLGTRTSAPLQDHADAHFHYMNHDPYGQQHIA